MAACSKPYRISSPTTKQAYFSGNLQQTLADLGFGPRGILHLDSLTPKLRPVATAAQAPAQAHTMPAVFVLQVGLLVLMVAVAAAVLLARPELSSLLSAGRVPNPRGCYSHVLGCCQLLASPGRLPSLYAATK